MKILREMVKPKREKTITFRMNEKELELLRRKAKQYTGGNLTAFAVAAFKKYVPSEKDLVRQ